MVNKKKIPKKTVKSKKKEVSKKNKVIKIKKSGLILNPKTKRYVKATGKIGKQLLAKQVVQRGGGKYLSRYLTSWDLGEDGAACRSGFDSYRRHDWHAGQWAYRRV